MSIKQIKCFKNNYYFLSNFFPCFVEYEGLIYPSAECAYQAAKTTNQIIRKYFTIMDNSMEARKWGNQIELREDWNTIRYEIMNTILHSKFSAPYLKELLLSTKDAYLEEGNAHGDKYWGTVKGIGENNLGKLLMNLRGELNEDINHGC